MMIHRFSGLAMACLLTVPFAAAQEKGIAKHPTLLAPADVKKIAILPDRVLLMGPDDSAQLVVTGEPAERVQDLTAQVKYTVANPAVAKVTEAGRVIPLSNGGTEISATFGGNSAKVQVTVQAIEDAPIDFGKQIVPLFSKLGCSGGGCHGKIGGQNGFALSLFGHDPEFDFQALVKESRGRRVMPTAPESSLMLLKATGAMAHAGGKRLQVGSDHYRLLRRWIASGTPFGSPHAPSLMKISVHPESRVLSRNNRQQLAVTAHYADGSTADITRQALYESNDNEVAVIDDAVLVRTRNMSGDAAIMVRYFDQVAVFRATVPFSAQPLQFTFEERTVVDRFTKKKWDHLGIAPSPLCTDEEFLRRVSLDLTGTLPTPKQVEAFLESKEPDKRDRLIDELLKTEEYSYVFANKWADILRVSRRSGLENSSRFHAWIRDAIASDMPYDSFVRGVLAATGDEAVHPPTTWYKELMEPQQLADDTAQLFLGLRVGCAQCHHHPYEKWSQDDYWSLAAFFGRVGRKDVPIPDSKDKKAVRLGIEVLKEGKVLNRRTNQPAKIQPLDGDPIQVPAGEDPRAQLVDWMANPKNPYFARAVANRYWSHFFGRGIVDPIDDMRVTNPPSNPELLDALGKELIDSKYSLKHLIKTIVRSRTYQLSSVPNDSNQLDRQSFARFYPRRLSAEVLFDAINQVTSSKAAFKLPGKGKVDKKADDGLRAIMLPDEGFSSYFLEVFGRPQRTSGCECERVADANLSQSLHFMNSDEMSKKFDAKADLLVKDKRSHDEKLKELFVLVYGRQATEEQLSLTLQHVSSATDKKAAYSNVLWALINTREFVFNH
ncbi:MAG: DUF1553 domain-containing protein [Gemmataceae bacterium]|nr:DUF1553 domain-containing protein [Gemmataceae bacterium]